MATLHLPAQHTSADLAVAGTLASLLESDELYVAWSQATGCAPPAVPAALRPEPEPEPERPGVLARALGWVRRRPRAA